MPSKPKPSPKPKPTPSTPGTVMRSALAKSDQTLADLARATKLSTSYLSLVASDRRGLSPENIPAVAAFLKVKPRSLLSASQLALMKALQAVAG